MTECVLYQRFLVQEFEVSSKHCSPPVGISFQYQSYEFLGCCTSW